MFKKLAAAILLGVILVEMPFGAALATPDVVIKEGEQSDNVILLQLRLQDLGYYNYKVTGFFGNFTKLALQDFQKTNGLPADGVAGTKTLEKMYGNDAKRNPIVDVNPPPTTKTQTKPKSKTYGKLVAWSTVNRAWKKGTDCKVIDLDTGKSYKMRRVGGSNHADVAPPDKSNNNIFKSTYGKNYPNWYRRAVVVNIPGLGWVAASTNGEPHGSTGVPGNGMTDPTDGSVGQVCFHFLNSKGHGHAVIDPAHQYQVYRAANKKPPMSRNSLVYPGD
jgi:peptidoglycan hydrolase-like protein with peptidoglycan-binding domain